MVYTVENFKTKKAFKDAVRNGEKVRLYQPGPFGPDVGVTDGWVHGIEGPHYPQPHRWYASAELVNGVVVKVK